MFRRKGENVLRRIAKYYGFTIDITGQEELPEGYLTETGNSGNRIAAGNDGVIAALRDYWEEQRQHQQICAVEVVEKDSRAAARKAKLQKKKQLQQQPGKTVASAPTIADSSQLSALNKPQSNVAARNTATFGSNDNEKV